MAALNIAIVGWHSHNQMFDEIGAELRQAGHHVVRYAHRDAFTATPDPLAGIDILLCVAVFPLTGAMFAASPRLRAIVSAVTGVDGIDIAAATERGILIANAQTEENIIGMAEATVLLMLAALYDLDGAQDRVRKGLWRPRNSRRPNSAARPSACSGSARSGAKPRVCSRRGAQPCSTAGAAMPTRPVCRRCSASTSTP